MEAFSILERIDVGETTNGSGAWLWVAGTFSILERIDVGETEIARRLDCRLFAFSILERIDVGETSSPTISPKTIKSFQYPRTDRRG